MARLMDGWAINIWADAAVILPVSHTATKIRKWRSVILFLLSNFPGPWISRKYIMVLL